ncbi:MAG: hypothetical protein QOI77_3920 [Blastocatellia bacterium]|nr:hypothetical protein [Blastocatellia bacterium]
MRPATSLLVPPAFLLVLAAIVIGIAMSANHSTSSAASAKAAAPQSTSLCAKDERVIFSCPVRRPAKIVSLCASKDLTSDRGYLQYRFGLPGKIDLEYPKDRQGTQSKFQYTHYFRAQFDMTSINFTIDGYEYSVFDDYNGEEKPKISTQGVSVTAPGKPKEVSFVCRTKPKADYNDLQAVLPSGQD